jgi:hypothetical protein
LIPRFNRPCNPCELGPLTGGGPWSIPANFAIPPPAAAKPLKPLPIRDDQDQMD